MTWMQTLTGQKVDLLSPDPDTIKPADIAHHLALINRYCGATREPISVARHSLLAAHDMTGREALVMLLHDAPEAYMGDAIRPLIEALDELAGGANALRHFKRTFHIKILDILGVIDSMMDPRYHKRDLRALAYERRAFMTPCDWDLELPSTPKTTKWEPLSWFKDREEFAQRWCELDPSLSMVRDFVQPWNRAGAVMPRSRTLTVPGEADDAPA